MDPVDTITFRQLMDASTDELNRLFAYVYSHPILCDDLTTYNNFLDSNLELIREPTFFSCCKQAILNAEKKVVCPSFTNCCRRDTQLLAQRLPKERPAQWSIILLSMVLKMIC